MRVHDWKTHLVHGSVIAGVFLCIVLIMYIILKVVNDTGTAHCHLTFGYNKEYYWYITYAFHTMHSDYGHLRNYHWKCLSLPPVK